MEAVALVLSGEGQSAHAEALAQASVLLALSLHRAASLQRLQIRGPESGDVGGRCSGVGEAVATEEGAALLDGGVGGQSDAASAESHADLPILLTESSDGGGVVLWILVDEGRLSL